MKLETSFPVGLSSPRQRSRNNSINFPHTPHPSYSRWGVLPPAPLLQNRTCDFHCIRLKRSLW
ncbi:MAG: hypothetical protein F6J93_33350 [Oscillatoria sp. SIO1A7]|nr:hypothetical protein [Oscillatoria sp. SIO1A7]